MNPYQQVVWDTKKAILESSQPVFSSVADDPPSAKPLFIAPTLTTYPQPGIGAFPMGPVAITSPAYIVPTGQFARIKVHALQHIGGSPPEFGPGGPVWRFLVNGAPLKGMGSVQTQIGAFATPIPTVIWLIENDVFQVTVEIPAGGNAIQGSSGYMASGYTAPLLAASRDTSGGVQ